MTEEEEAQELEPPPSSDAIHENSALERRQLNLIFQAMAHLTTSLIQLHSRLDCLEQTVNRTQDHLQAFDLKFQRQILGRERAEFPIEP
jgi:hypothetical protein